MQRNPRAESAADAAEFPALSTKQLALAKLEAQLAES
jgi:hypothetical protein